MALVGKTEAHRHQRRWLAGCEQATGLGQAQLDQIGMRRQPEGRLERPRQPEAIDAGGARQIVQSQILIHVRMQIVPRPQRHGRQARVGSQPRSP